jgi:GIY-YIG catalytic domain
MCFVYALLCAENGLAYVGSTFDLKRRMRQHRCEIRRGTHPAKALVADWQRYGEASFRVIALEVLPDDLPDFELRGAEWRWQRLFAALGRLYITQMTRSLNTLGQLPEADVTRCMAALEEAQRVGGLPLRRRRSASSSRDEKSAREETNNPQKPRKRSRRDGKSTEEPACPPAQGNGQARDEDLPSRSDR